jgi:DNA-binding NarL/FixJ family response regulator
MGFPAEKKTIKNTHSLLFIKDIKYEADRLPLPLRKNYRINYHHTPQKRNNSKIKIALIDSRSLTRISFTHLLETSTPAKRRSEDFAILPFSSTDELLANSSEDRSNMRLTIFNIGAACTSEDEEICQDIHRLKQELPNVPLVILSERNERSCILEALRSGIHSYISTTLSPQIVIQALRLILVGGKFIPLHFFLNSAEEVLGSIQESHDRVNDARIRILQDQLLRKGKSNKIIAYELNMQESTVKVHVRQIMKKLKAINRTHAVFLASQIMEEKLT